MKPARTLWNEFIGFLFLCFGGNLRLRHVRSTLPCEGRRGIGDLGRTVVAGFCTLLMLWFGVGLLPAGA